MDVIFDLFSLWRKIVSLLLRGIFTQTPLVWRARELGEFGAILWRRIILPRLRKNFAWPNNVLRRDPKKDSWIGYLPYSRIWRTDWDKCSVQSLFFKVCFGPWVRNGEGETPWYRDLMPLWWFWIMSEFPETSWPSQKWEGTYLSHYIFSWAHYWSGSETCRLQFWRSSVCL